MTGRELARALLERGARLWLEHARAGVRVAFDAPAGAVSDELRAVAATLRAELLEVVASAEERAAILVHEAGLDGPTAERLAWLETLAPALDPAPARPGREPSRPSSKRASACNYKHSPRSVGGSGGPGNKDAFRKTSPKKLWVPPIARCRT